MGRFLFNERYDFDAQRFGPEANAHFLYIIHISFEKVPEIRLCFAGETGKVGKGGIHDV